jgi:hypothetical protein
MDPRHFGRASIARTEKVPMRAGALGGDLKLFAITFTAGFLFVSILIG